MNILLTSGYNASKHSLAVLELLRRENIAVSKCIIVNVFSSKRLKYYFKQLDFKEFKKKAIDRVFPGLVAKEKRSDEIKYINDFLEQHHIEKTSLSQYCKKHHIPYLKTNSLNNDKALSFINDIDLVIYTGGGILGKSFIEKIKNGILNCHGGRLPEVRGMNSGEWSVLLGIPPANTMHFIVRKIDMGPIITIKNKSYKACENIDQLRGKAITYAVEDLVETTKKIVSGNFTLTNQRLEDGKQYYTMHPVLKNMVNYILMKSKSL